MGTIQVIKHKSGPTYRINKPGTESTFDEVYKVTWIGSSGQDSFPGDEFVIANASVPRPQNRYNDCGYNFRNWIVDNVEWRANQEVPHSFTVTVRYTSVVPYAQGFRRPWTRITRTTQMRQMQIWTMWSGAIDESSYVWPPTTTIQGQHVDINGVPSLYQVPQQSFTVECYFHRGLETLAGSPINEPPFFCTSYAGSRNDDSFLGFPTGTVLYQGFSASPVNDQTYILAYRFLYDQFGFFEQRPAPAVNNKYFMEPSQSQFIGVPYTICTKVGWYQPYTTKITMSGLFPSNVYSALGTTVPAQNSC